jgi:hypothetical protein
MVPAAVQAGPIPSEPNPGSQNVLGTVLKDGDNFWLVIQPPHLDINDDAEGESIRREDGNGHWHDRSGQ